MNPPNILKTNLYNTKEKTANRPIRSKQKKIKLQQPNTFNSDKFGRKREETQETETTQRKTVQVARKQRKKCSKTISKQQWETIVLTISNFNGR